MPAEGPRFPSHLVEHLAQVHDNGLMDLLPQVGAHDLDERDLERGDLSVPADEERDDGGTQGTRGHTIRLRTHESQHMQCRVNTHLHPPRISQNINTTTTTTTTSMRHCVQQAHAAYGACFSHEDTGEVQLHLEAHVHVGAVDGRRPPQREAAVRDLVQTTALRVGQLLVPAVCCGQWAKGQAGGQDVVYVLWCA